LSAYPNRDWEKVYRDIARVDSTFHFVCNPNDTHGCYLRAYMRNGVMVRLGPSYGYGQASDLYGNKASARWDPRCCQKGLVLNRRIYGDRRVKAPMVRKGFREWVQAGFPRDPETGRVPEQYLRRGRDTWEKVSFEEAAQLVAQALLNITNTYSGERGQEFLRRQGYDPAMVEAVAGAGTQVVKLRGGMPLLGVTRIFGMYRFANMLALLDAYNRGVAPEEAEGARGWDNYSWHTDLPPGHTMVTGQQTVDFDLFDAENARLIVCWGMNWLTTKMPDGHWLAEARLKGAQVVTIACEYQATSVRADHVVMARPGSDTAVALGMCHVILKEGLYDPAFVKEHTDLPLLVRTDTLKLLRAADLDAQWQPAALSNRTVVLKEGEKPPPPGKQGTQWIPEGLRRSWGDFVVWDARARRPAVVTRDQVGERFRQSGLDPALEGAFRVKLADGSTVTVRPIFDLIREHVLKHYDPVSVSKVAWIRADLVEKLARLVAAHKEKTLFAVGMGPNHFFNNDQKDRAIFLLAALTRNIGFHGGNVGSYAGNYRGAYFNGLPTFILEDPFHPQTDPAGPVQVKKYYHAESAHYFNYGDRPLRLGQRNFTGKSHTPTPTKAMWTANSNSILGNIKWHYDVVTNTLPKVEMVVTSEWWWTLTCEWADVVFPVDSWAELKYPDMTASCTHPFLQVMPSTPMNRLFDSRSDLDWMAGVAAALADLTGDGRFRDYWKFVHDGKVQVYLQRILDASSTTKGYKIEELEERARQGIPALLMTRTYPTSKGWEQTHESVPWYTRTGRLEFYREEDEFLEHGENLPLHREPVDGTPYEPNVIMAGAGSVIRPSPPQAFGLAISDLSCEARQVRNVVRSADQIVASRHPLGQGLVFITPKYRWGAHTTPIDSDLITVFFGPFGDLYRRDKRMPYVGESYVDLHPDDARALGISDGDYVTLEADPGDRPFRGWKPGDREHRFARLVCRARYYPGIVRGIARMWFNMYQASPGSVLGLETRPDGLAKNPETGYQALFRYGGHQSCVRAWLRPTLMTETLPRKGYFGQQIGQGFEPDVHCPVGAPKESFVHIRKVEDGGMQGQRLWRPAELGLRPGLESPLMRRFIAGDFVKILGG
jgi:nitrate reductase alpha subunit